MGQAHPIPEPDLGPSLRIYTCSKPDRLATQPRLIGEGWGESPVLTQPIVIPRVEVCSGVVLGLIR